MRSFRTSASIPFIFGEGCSKETGNELKNMGVKRLFVVYDKGVMKAGIVAPILNTLDKVGISYVCFDKVMPDPTEQCVEEATELARKEKIDSVLGIGGGSAIDVAKVVAVYRHLKEPLKEYLTGGARCDMFYKRYREGSLIFIPTTSGTGAEMSIGGVITDTDAKTKKSFDGLACKADLAILDPVLTLSLPPYITATTGVDALCHSIETMTGLKRSDRTDMINGHAVKLIWRSLFKAFQDGTNLEARGELMIGASLAFTSDAGTNFGHGIAHALGEIHLAHGHVCALILPQYVRYMGKSRTAEKEMMYIAELMGIEVTLDNVGEKIAEAIEGMTKKMGLKTPKELEIDKGVFMAGVDDLFTNQIERVNRGNPAPTREEIIDMFEKMY